VIKVLVVDDHAVVRDGLRALLSSSEGFECVGTAGDGAEALVAARQLAPDVIVMDLSMPRMDGVEATRRLHASGGPPVLILSMSDDDAALVSALRAGAVGYLLKDAESEHVLDAIKGAARGEVVFGRGVAQSALHLLRAPAEARRPLPELTDREREILSLVASGLSNPVVAQRLGISAKTVANSMSAVLVKLGVRDRAAAIAAAKAAGLSRA
jgi:DNA-binding NarL/FixJ family response regulator